MRRTFLVSSVISLALCGASPGAQPLDEETPFDQSLRVAEEARVRVILEAIYFDPTREAGTPSAAEREYWLNKLRESDLVALQSVLDQKWNETANRWPELFSFGDHVVMCAEIWAKMEPPPESTFLYTLDNSLPRPNPAAMTEMNRWLHFEAKRRIREEHAAARRQRAVSEAHFLIWRRPEISVHVWGEFLNQDQIARLLEIDRTAIASKRGVILCALENGGAI